MTDENAERETLRHTIIALREARDVSNPGSAEYQEFDRRMKQAEADLAAVGRPKRPGSQPTQGPL